jgi:lia operon protein LiaG
MEKKILKKTVLITTAVAVASLGIAALIGFATAGFRPSQFGRSGGGTTVDEKASLPIAGIGLLTVSAVSEEVRITEGTGSDIEAWFHGSVGTSSPDAVPHLVADTTGGTAVVRVDRKQGLQIGFFGSDLVLEVRVPAGYAQKLSVQSVSGGIDLAGHAYAGLSLASTSGEISVGALKAASVTMHTTSGDLVAESVSSLHSEFSAVSGSIQVRALTGDAAVHTISGDVKLAYTAAPSQIDASSTSGSVTIVFPADASFYLDARSASGDVKCAFPVTISENRAGGGAHLLVGTVGSGTGGVSIRTVSGDIRVAK